MKIKCGLFRFVSLSFYFRGGNGGCFFSFSSFREGFFLVIDFYGGCVVVIRWRGIKVWRGTDFCVGR